MVQNPAICHMQFSLRVERYHSVPLTAARAPKKTAGHGLNDLGEDALEPNKKTINRWLWPNPFRNQDTSVSKAKQAISHYKKAVGDPAGLTELMVFYCEQATGYCQKRKDFSMLWYACSSVR